MSRKKILEPGEKFSYEASDEILEEVQNLRHVGEQDAIDVYENAFREKAKAIVSSISDEDETNSDENETNSDENKTNSDENKKKPDDSSES